MKFTTPYTTMFVALVVANTSALAADTGVYACVSKMDSVAAITNNSMTVGNNTKPLQIEIIEAKQNDDKICKIGQYHGYYSAYCTSRYEATVKGLGAPLRFYGDETTNFRGWLPTDYLVVFDDGFMMSFKFGPIVIARIGDCKRL